MFAQNHDRFSGITPFGCLLGKRPSARSIMQSCRTAALIFCCLFSGASVNASDLRSAIEAGRFADFRSETMEAWARGDIEAI